MPILSPQDLALAVMNQRKKLKLSQAEVGDRVGVKQQTISRFEQNPEGTKLETLFHILSAVNLDMTVLSRDQPSEAEKQWKEEW